LAGMEVPQLLKLAGRPLAGAEVTALKRLRRKLRNKHSAACSRQKRREYIQDLEEHLEGVKTENIRLASRVRELELENEQLRRGASSLVLPLEKVPPPDLGTADDKRTLRSSFGGRSRTAGVALMS